MTQPTEIELGSPLPPGTRLHEFRIDRVLGEGGFGIVYVAQDEQLQRVVAIKEYMPSSLATRQTNLTVQVRSERHRETFDLALRSFVNEARLLASFDHPSLVKVYRFWEQNGTAYMAMPFYEGPTLRRWLNDQPQPPEEQWLKAILAPLLEALDVIHADSCFHRDIAPDNILLVGPRQRPVLLDFGAARRVITDATQALTAILKPGYAPIEQYAEIPSLKQGAWTDVYALCAVLHAALTGSPPLPAVSRMVKDEQQPLAVRLAGRYSAPFLEAVDRGLAVMPEQRPQSIAELREYLWAAEGRSAPAVNGDAAGDADDAEFTRVLPRSAETPAVAPGTLHPSPPAEPAAEPDHLTFPPAQKARRPWVWVAGGVMGVAMLASGEWVLRPVLLAPSKAQPVAEQAPQPAPIAVPTNTTSTAPTTTTANAPPDSASRVNDRPADPVQAPPIQASSRGAFTPLAALDELWTRRDITREVSASADRPRMVIGRDELRFSFRSSQAGFAYIFHVGTDGKHLSLLFPNAEERDNKVAPGVTYKIPRNPQNLSLTAAGPAGDNHLLVMVSKEPRQFESSGLVKGGLISEFDISRVQQRWAQAPWEAPVLSGTPACANRPPCDAGYGAAVLKVEEVLR